MRYANWATSKDGLTVLILREGTETVEEQPYCFEHAPQPPAPEPSPIERAHRFQSHRSNRKLREDYGMDERY